MCGVLVAPYIFPTTPVGSSSTAVGAALRVVGALHATDGIARLLLATTTRLVPARNARRLRSDMIPPCRGSSNGPSEFTERVDHGALAEDLRQHLGLTGGATRIEQVERHAVAPERPEHARDGGIALRPVRLERGHALARERLGDGG